MAVVDMIFDIPPVDAVTLWTWIGGTVAWIGGIVVYPISWIRAQFKTMNEKFLTISDFDEHVENHERLHAEGTDAIRRDLARLEQGQNMILSKLINK
jgi:hypothetical protein